MEQQMIGNKKIIKYLCFFNVLVIIFSGLIGCSKKETNKSSQMDIGDIGNKISVNDTVAYVAGENKILVPYDFSGSFNECSNEACKKTLVGCENPRMPTVETDDLPEEVAREIISFYGDVGGFWTSAEAYHSTIEIAGYESESLHYAGIMTNYFSVGNDGVADAMYGYYLEGQEDYMIYGLLVLYDITNDFVFVFTDIEDTANPNYSTEPFFSDVTSEKNNESVDTSTSNNDLTNNNNSYNEDNNHDYSSNYVDFEDNTSADNMSDDDIFNDNTSTTSKNEEVKYEVGKKISFGKDLDSEQNWTIVDVQNDKALIISYLCSAQVEHYSKIYTWENCNLRKYLNGSYYDSLKNSRKSRILETKVVNSDNPEYNTEGGNDTVDKIFVLSVDEATKYSQYITEMLRYGDLWLRTPGKGTCETMYCYDYPYGEFKISYEGEGVSYNKNALIGCWISIY